MWSLHPCEVGNFVEEILQAEDRERKESGKLMEMGSTLEREEEGTAETDKGRQSAKDRDLRWLQCWLMACGTVVDLRGKRS